MKSHLLSVIAILTIIFSQNAYSQEQEMLPNGSVEISYTIWPEEIQFGDPVFLSLYVKNLSDGTISFSISDSFVRGLFVERGQMSCVIIGSDNSRWHPVFTRQGARIFITAIPNRPLPIINIPPNEKVRVDVDHFSTCNFVEMFSNRMPWAPGSVEIYIPNFRPDLRMSVNPKKPTLSIVPRKCDEERYFIGSCWKQGWGHMFQSFETSAGRLMLREVFMLGDMAGFPVGADIRNWQNLKAREQSFSEGTYRDELRLGRIILQYVDTNDSAVLEELYDWFSELPEVQRTSYSRLLRARVLSRLTVENFTDNLSQAHKRMIALYKHIQEFDVLPFGEEEMALLEKLGVL